MSDNLYDFATGKATSLEQQLKNKLVNRGGPPHNGDMEQRLTRIEAIIPTLATKEDLAREAGAIRAELHSAIAAQTWKIVTAIGASGTALTAAVYFLAKNA